MLALSSILAISCMKDGEMLVATLEGDGTQIGTVDSDIVLDINDPSALALTIWWDELGNASLSNPDAQIPDDMIINAIQFSTEEDFSTYTEEELDNSATSVQFTAAELNSIVTGLGVEGGVATDIHIRMKTALGSNTEPVYGNSITVTVTPYFVDMSRIRLAGTSNGTYTGTEVTIPASAGNEGEYAGFANISTGWWNFFFIEGDGNIWGALADGENQFYLEQKSDISSWNVWFPEPVGCYYITMSTASAQWTAIHISDAAMTVTGSEIQMEYSEDNTAYTAVFTTGSDSQDIQVSFSGTLYNATLGEGSTETASIALSANPDGSLTAEEAGASTGFTAGAAGTYTLILRLSEMTWEIAEGEVDIDEGGDGEQWPEDDAYVPATSEYLYIYDFDNGPAATAGRLARTADGVYEGFFYMAGWYNFLFGDAEDSSAATVIYGSAPDSDPDAVYRLFCGESRYNIWWPSGTGAYVYLTVDTNQRSWSYTEITSISIAGDFNGYSLESDVMTFDSATRTWSAVITPGSWGEWGIQFCINSGWDMCYAPARDGTLYLSSNAAMPPVEVEPGVQYTVTVDLNDPAHMTYSIEAAGDGPQEPEYSQYLYVFYTWPTEGYWQERLAGALYSPDGDGVYTGFFTTGNSWNTAEGYASPYVNYTFGTGSTANSGIKYGIDNNAALVENGGTNGWVEHLGLHELTADLVNMTVTGTYIGQVSVLNTATDGTTSMAFDDVSDFVWEATCTFSAGDTFRIILGDNVYSFGGSDGTLSEDGADITVPQDGSYLVTADLKDRSALTFTLTLQ